MLAPGLRPRDQAQAWQDEAADTRRRLHALLATITAEEWASLVTIRDRQRPLGDWIGGALSGDAGPGTHAAEHAVQIRAWRAACERDVGP